MARVPKCQGFGNTIDFDLNLVIPNKTLYAGRRRDRAVDQAEVQAAGHGDEALRARGRRSARCAVAGPDREQQSFVLKGDDKWWGVRGFFDYLERKKYKLHVRVFLSRYRGYSVCPDCGGLRLRREARQVKDWRQGHLPGVGDDGGRGDEVSSPNCSSRGKRLTSPNDCWIEIRDRLRFLNDVGLEYLTLDRLASTLSGGEAQRIQLATSLGSRLVGTLYVLDEPSIGLHSRDTDRLIKILHSLRDLGNTMLVVEHDAEIMRHADRIIDLGPGAGENGGKVIATGTYDEILHNPASLTGRYLESRAAHPDARCPAHRQRQGDPSCSERAHTT